MDQHCAYLLKILSAAIRGNIPPEPDFEPVYWDRIFSEAVAHGVHTLIYPSLNMLAFQLQIPSPVLEKWKNICLLSAAKQIQYMDEAFHILKILHDAQIPVIILKGLLLRELYPQPEMRTMGDIDILVRPTDIKSAVTLIEKLGYLRKEHGGSVKAFYKQNFLHIEMHYTLFNPERFKTLYDFENQIWNHSQQHTIGGQMAFTLSCEDNLIYLLIHMAKHFLDSGFGLRQLCDVCLFIETYTAKINWSFFWLTINQLGYGTFVMTVFEACRQFFGLKVAVSVVANNAVSKETILLFIQDVISSGVYGRKTQSRFFGNNIIQRTNNIKNSRKLNKIIPFLTISYGLFPPRINIENKYTYVHNYPILLPIAWLHRILYFIFASGNSPREIVRIMKNIPIIAEQRKELIKKLKLR